MLRFGQGGPATVLDGPGRKLRRTLPATRHHLDTSFKHPPSFNSPVPLSGRVNSAASQGPAWQPWLGPTNTGQGSAPGQSPPVANSQQQAEGPATPSNNPSSSASTSKEAEGAQQHQSGASNSSSHNNSNSDEGLSAGNFHLKPIHILLFSLIFVGGAAFATITLQFTAGMEFRLAVTTVLRRVAKSAAFRQLVVIGFTVILLRFGLNNLMQTLAKFSLSPVQWDKTKLYYLLREVYQPLELLLLVAALCTISDAFLPSLIAIPKATVSHVVKSILSTSFIIGFATVVFNLKSRFCKENAWQAEMKGDATSQRRWEAYDKLGTFVIFVMSIVLGIQAMGLEVGSVLAIGGIGGLAIGLAGREICENLLSGFLIMSTNPFEVGDEVTFFHNNKVIEGIVADIGWYRTLIRSFEREMFVIPNAVFSKNIVLNVTRKGREWRLLETIYIRVQDVQKANAIAQDIRRIMRSDTRVMNKLHRRVFVDKITKEDVQIYMSFYLDAANRDAFMAIKQDLMVSFVDCVERNGAKLATPRTVLDLDPEMVDALDSLNVQGYAAYAMARDLVAQKQHQAQMQPAQLPSSPVITAEITAVDRSPPNGPSSDSNSSSSNNGGGAGVRGSAGSSGGTATKELVGTSSVMTSADCIPPPSSSPQQTYTSATNHFIPSSLPPPSNSSHQQCRDTSSSSSSSSSGQGLGYGPSPNHSSGVQHRVGDVYSTHTITGLLHVPSPPADPVAYAAAIANAQNKVVSANIVPSSPLTASRSTNSSNSSSRGGSGGGSGGAGVAGREGRPTGSGGGLELDLSEDEKAEERRVHLVGGGGVVTWAGQTAGKEAGRGTTKGSVATAVSSKESLASSSVVTPSTSANPSPSVSPSRKGKGLFSSKSSSPGPSSTTSSSSSPSSSSRKSRNDSSSTSSSIGSRGSSPHRSGDSQAAKVNALQQDHQARQARHQSPAPDHELTRDFSGSSPPGPTGLPVKWLQHIATMVFKDS